MYETLLERFGRGRAAHRPPHHRVEVEPPRLNEKVREYFQTAPAKGGGWLQMPEIPDADEILDRNIVGARSSSNASETSSNVSLTPNRRKGAWESKEEYLSAHYQLLREDAIRPLREAISKVRMAPQAQEDAFEGNVGIYEKVHICAVKCSPRGIAVRVTFSLFRTGKKILWEQSKRLMTGSLVVLTPAEDQFRTKAIIATVAARPLEAGLRLNPPEIELFFAHPDEIEIDPAQEFWMVESRGSMFEADRHTLVALQRMMVEPFPLKEHLIDIESKVSPPHYLDASPELDLRTVLFNNKHETYKNVDVLQAWPETPDSNLDASQLAALRRILTKRLAVVQGPPGTGKTHITVEAIKIMLENQRPNDPPIIIACQTNHAVDQLLNHIAYFEAEFLRLGSRSKDKGIVKERTLYEVKQLMSANRVAGSLGASGRKKMKALTKEFAKVLAPLDADGMPLRFDLLAGFNILTARQAESLEAGSSRWVQSTLSNVKEARQSPFNVWLSAHLIRVLSKQQAEDFGFDYEEADLEYEQLRDIEAENKEEDELEELSGESFPIADNFTCRKTPNVNAAKVQQALQEQDMWKIPEAVRPAVYRYLQSEQKKLILIQFRKLARQYQEAIQQRRIGTMEQDETVLRNQKIIGMTTTGLSKYRGLLAALEPKIVLIEEAAEVLEAPVAVACLPTLQHLILVGDHKQLRPHCHVKAHEDKPFYLNVSLFERLVNNGIEYDTLCKQRRMIPEIRRILHPIYKNVIKDHESVLDTDKRPPVPGMGCVNSWFFVHQWPEQRDDLNSAYNPKEVEMIVGFVKHLVCNGTTTENITILTFYNGQRKKLLRGLLSDVELVGCHFNVVTVDSYQGEENDVVILSLVRSNPQGQIGFLDIDNRVCVALSRAKCGFYMFGNGQLLWNFPTWNSVIKIMANNGPQVDRLTIEPVNRLDESLPVRCINHDEVTRVSNPEDWKALKGGCTRPCGGTLPCGHRCTLPCHPFEHERVNCFEVCGKPLRCCGQPCREVCAELCVCKACKKIKPMEVKPVDDAPLPRTAPVKPPTDLIELFDNVSISGGMAVHPHAQNGAVVTQGMTSVTVESDAVGRKGCKKWTTILNPTPQASPPALQKKKKEGAEWVPEPSLLD